MGGSSHREIITDDGMRTVGCRGHTAAVVYMGPHARRIVAEFQDKVWAAGCLLLSIFPLTVIVQEGIGPLEYKLHENGFLSVLFTAESSALKLIVLAHDRCSINIK